ncbi:hypothetical protein JCM16303_003744 [Sporobolomyces ruberrimus]
MSSDGSIPPRPPKPIVVPFLLTLALFSFVAVLTLSPPTRLLRKLHRLFIRPITVLLGRVPLPAALESPSNLSISIKNYSSYSHDQQLAIDRKRLAYERMPARHRRIGKHLDWRRVLERTEDAVEANSKVTDQLAAIGLEFARKEGIPYGFNTRHKKESGRVVETLKHFVRDWSQEGKSERDALFPPILETLASEFPFAKDESRKVLVPGCGLGRLAYEISTQGFSTIANDFSHFMTLATSLIFSRTHSSNQHSIHPYIHSFSHQRTSQNLLRTVSFPDIVPRKQDVDLEFVQGDFLSLFFEEDEKFDAIVTLFFIDTASNLLDYFETIYRLLKPRGIWINEGPLLYYGNPGMELPLEDVIRAAELVGFVIEKRRTLKEVRYTADAKGKQVLLATTFFLIFFFPPRSNEEADP